MTEYRVYRTGEDEPVRRVSRPQRGAQPLRRPPRPSDGGRRSRRWRDVLVGGVAAALLIALIVLGWVYGRELYANSLAAVDLARLSGKVPGWALWAAPAAVVLVLALSTGYLAFGRHVALKIIGLATVVTVLAMPGLALGWANGTVSTVSERTEEVEQIVEKVEEQLRPALPGKAVNILLIGKDGSTPGDPGRADTQMLVRLDPDSKSISVLSVPRDWRVDIPGVGYNKMNAAYFFGGPSLVVETFTKATGVPVNHFIEVDFEGFRHAVNILGGLYLPVDRRYYNATDNSYQKLDIQPGYQLLNGGDALHFVRFRHDEKGDFGRMQRQQLFLREAQRQSARWSEDWTKAARLVRALTNETTSDVNSLKRLKPLVELVFQVDASNVHTVHLEGSTPMIDGISYVVPSQEQIAAAVSEFTNPTQAPATKGAVVVSKNAYTVTVHNASGVAGLTDNAIAQLKNLRYKVRKGADAAEFPGSVTVIYAPKGLASQAKTLAAMIPGAKVKTVQRVPGRLDGIRIFVTSSFDGALDVTQTSSTGTTQYYLQKGANYDVAGWKALQRTTKVRLERPTAWSPSFVYDEYYAYRLTTAEGKKYAAAVAVVKTPRWGYWSIQAMRWLNPPAIQNPSSKEIVNGVEYLHFYEGNRLHMVAWKRNKTLYWVLNTLDNQLSNDLMRDLALSFKPVK